MSPEQPLTRAGVRAWAVATAQARGIDAGEVTGVAHERFEDDQVAGGFAFRAGRVVLVATRDGAHGSHLDPGDEAGRLAVVEKVWQAARRRTRVLTVDDLGPHQRAVLAAVRHGVRRVAALEPSERPGVGPAELPGAEWLLMVLRAHHQAGAPTTAEALSILTGADHLLATPPADAPVHPCPLCHGLAPWSEHHPRALCAACAAMSRCPHGRGVRGRNASFSGGFETVHTDDQSACEDATRDGTVTVTGWPCRMGEARPGGVVVEAHPSEVAASDPWAVATAARDLVGLLREVAGLPVPPPPEDTHRAVDDLDRHLRALADDLASRMAAAWCHDHGGEEPATRDGLLRLLDPSWA